MAAAEAYYDEDDYLMLVKRPAVKPKKKVEEKVVVEISLEELTKRAADKLFYCRKYGPFRIGEVSNLVYATKEGKVEHLTNTACHAALNYSVPVGCRLVVSGIQKKTCTEHDEAFLDWLLNRSAWSHSFIEHDAKEAIAKGYTVSDAKALGNIMVSGSIAARYVSEWYERVEWWHELVKAGCNESMAFILIHMMHKGGRRVMFNQRHEGHTAIYVGSIPVSGAIRFCNDLKFSEGQCLDPYELSPKYHGLMYIFGLDNKKNICAYLQSLFNLRTKEVKKEKIDTNPFAFNPPPNLGYVDADAGLKIMSEIVDELLKGES